MFDISNEKWKIELEWIGDDLKGHIPVSSDKHLAFAQVVWKMEHSSSKDCQQRAKAIAKLPDMLRILMEFDNVMTDANNWIDTTDEKQKLCDIVADARALIGEINHVQDSIPS